MLEQRGKGHRPGREKDGTSKARRSLALTVCLVEAQHLKIYRLDKGIEHFNLNITQPIHHFHRYIFAIGSSILEISHPKSHDRLPQMSYIAEKSSSGALGALGALGASGASASSNELS
jgi:hypothetical protein